jgi:hypothetical protein
VHATGTCYIEQISSNYGENFIYFSGVWRISYFARTAENVFRDRIFITYTYNFI